MKVGHEAQNNASRAASLLARLNLQRQHLQFCDCVIRQGQGQVYSVHRCILAASSPVLASYLSSTGILVELEEPCLSDSVLELLIDYIYTGTVPYLDNKLYSDLLAAAQYLEIQELQSALRTMVDDMEYHSKFALSEATTSTQFTLSPPQICYYENTPNSPHSVCSTGNTFYQFKTNLEVTKDRQVNSCRTDLSSDAKTENYNGRIDPLRTDGLDDAPMTTCNMTVNSCCIPKNDLPSHNFFQNINSSGVTEELSTICQEREKDQSAEAIKQDTWQESKEELCSSMEPRPYSSCSTKEQKNEDITVEEKTKLCLQSCVKSEEMQPKSLGSHCSSTSPPHPRCGVVPVICHSSRADRIIFTGKLPSERIYCNDVDDGLTQTEHYINHKDYIRKQNQDESDGSVRPDQEHNSANCLFKEKYKLLDSEQSTQMLKSSFDSETSNKKIQYELDHSCNDFSKDMTKVTSGKDPTQLHVQKVNPPNKEKCNTRIKFTYKGMCGKRKLKEEPNDKCSESAKNERTKTGSHTNKTDADNGTDSTSAEQDTIVIYKNTSTSKTSKMCRSLSLSPEEDTCKSAFSGTEQQYSGHLYYHCHSQPGANKPRYKQFSPNLLSAPDPRLNNSDKSSEDSDAPLFGILSQKKQHSTVFDKEQVVLLDISTKSAEIVSYSHTSEMERTCVAGFTDETLMKISQSVFDRVSESKTTANDREYQECYVQHRASSHKEENILSSSLTSCTSACGKDCVHDSVSSSLSDHILIPPASSMQTNISKHLSSPGHQAFQCSLCERSFSQRGSLNRHVRSHLGVRPFPCPHCPMTFSRQYRVTEHMRVHQRSSLGNDFTKPPASSV